MTSSRDSDALRDALRVAVPVESADKVSARRAQLLASLEREIAAAPERIKQAQSRARLRTFLRLSAAAAALAATLGLGMLLSGAPSANETVATSAAQNGKPTAQTAIRPSEPPYQSQSGKTFETRSGDERDIALAGGTSLSVAAHTKVMVDLDSSDEQTLRLARGAISLFVPPDRGQRSVQVQTAHATVRVKGTVFSVEVGRFDQPTGTPFRTRVTVTRGRVFVEHPAGEISLVAGETWTSPLEGTAAVAQSKTSAGARPGSRTNAAPPTSATTSTTTLSKLRRPQSVDKTNNAGARAPREDKESTLAAQNSLLERALSAERRGDLVQARALVDSFLESYPSSPLRGSALAVKKRLRD